MVDKNAWPIDWSPEEREKIQEQARRRGYEALKDYLMALVEEDIEEDPEAAFRQGWHEVMAGQTYPVSTLWDFLDDE